MHLTELLGFNVTHSMQCVRVMAKDPERQLISMFMSGSEHSIRLLRVDLRSRMSG